MVARFRVGRPKFELGRFLSQLTRNPGRFWTAQRESWRREGLKTSLVRPKRAENTVVMRKHGDVAPRCEQNRAQKWPKTGCARHVS